MVIEYESPGVQVGVEFVELHHLQVMEVRLTDMHMNNPLSFGSSVYGCESVNMLLQ